MNEETKKIELTKNQKRKLEKNKGTKIVYIKQYHPIAKRNVIMPVRVSEDNIGPWTKDTKFSTMQIRSESDKECNKNSNREEKINSEMAMAELHKINSVLNRSENEN